MHSLGQRIRELRLQKGLTQAELTKGICTPSMCSQIESDRARPSYKMLAQIADRLDVSLEKLLSDVELNLEVTSTFRMARAMVASKDFVAAIPLLHELLDTASGTIPRMEVLFDLAQSYLHTGEFDQAEKWLAELRDLAVFRQDHRSLIRVFIQTGHIWMERKHYQLAVYQWQQALDQLEKLQDPDMMLKESLLFRLGQAHSKLGCMGEAVACYQQALQVCEENDDLYKRARLYLELAQSYKRIGNLQQAITHAERAAHVYEMLDQVAMKIMLELECAIVFGQSGREQEAMPMLHKVIRKLQELGKQTEAGMAFVELARIQLQAGDVDRAAEHCQVARTLLPELHAYQAWVHRILGEIAREKGERAEAVRRFERAADCFKRMDQIPEWEQTMYDLSRLYQEEQQPEQVISILDALRNFTHHVLNERGIVL